MLFLLCLRSSKDVSVTKCFHGVALFGSRSILVLECGKLEVSPWTGSGGIPLVFDRDDGYVLIFDFWMVAARKASFVDVGGVVVCGGLG